MDEFYVLICILKVKAKWKYPIRHSNRIAYFGFSLFYLSNYSE